MKHNSQQSMNYICYAVINEWPNGFGFVRLSENDGKANSISVISILFIVYQP